MFCWLLLLSLFLVSFLFQRFFLYSWFPGGCWWVPGGCWWVSGVLMLLTVLMLLVPDAANSGCSARCDISYAQHAFSSARMFGTYSSLRWTRLFHETCGLCSSKICFCSCVMVHVPWCTMMYLWQQGQRCSTRQRMEKLQERIRTGVSGCQVASTLRLWNAVFWPWFRQMTFSWTS